jgi:hypothetical protein
MDSRALMRALEGRVADVEFLAGQRGAAAFSWIQPREIVSI